MLIVIFIVFALLSWAVSSRLKNKFKKYSQVGLQTGLSGREIVELMLVDHGIQDVKITCQPGKLTDHYNPSNRTVNLSEDVYHGKSVASAAVAAHECGHAVQHAKAYSFLEFRSAMVPVQSISARLMNFIMLAMIFGGGFLYGLGIQNIILVIIAAQFVMTLFSVVTLPVEFDASNRALAWITNRGMVNGQEHEMAKDALKWAAMTYVVAALGSIMTLFYWLMVFMGGSRD